MRILNLSTISSSPYPLQFADPSFDDEIANATDALFPTTNKRLKILLVDDQEDFREALAYNLEEVFGANVKQVETGVDAIRLVSAGNCFDLIFLDLMMFPMNGIRAYSELKRIDSHCRIVIMSAYTDSPEWIEAQQLGAEMITKPIDNDSLENALSRGR